MKIIVAIWLYTFQPVIDVLLASYHFIVWIAFGFPVYNPDNDIEYKLDPLWGALNYNWIFEYQAVVNDYRGDCDKQATNWKWKIPGGSRYSVFPNNLKNITSTHVVYVYERDGKSFVCSNNNCYNMKLDEYIERSFNNVVVVKMPY